MAQGVNAETVERAALAYLNRFDSSVANLRRVLRRQMQRRIGKELPPEARPEATQQADQAIGSLIDRFEQSGILNDERFAQAQVDYYRRRGTSTRALRMKLRHKGVPEAIVDVAMAKSAADTGDTELCAARAYAKRRRLGPYRTSRAGTLCDDDPLSRDRQPGDGDQQSAARYQKDLAKMARAGFDFATARQALSPTNPDAF